ncbi:hypothetical protein CEXT_699491 [Caerostris extrusa]|uniref:Nose resistant-to-fluoxetine protein N-terminal domain-containing protein n=1 Tax=Caerostris extrusa TaxID=172846 RepID=A0AAV4TTL1_CAEEX|nr:hypothetical protein CEXT_699491 [Caerostris extrusa]
MQMIAGLRKMKTWAFSFVDSSAKLPEGLASATFTFLGVYEQCLDIRVPHPKLEGQSQFRNCLLYSGSFFVFLGTLLELRSKSENTKPSNLGHRILLSFSMITNFAKLTSTKTSVESFNCLHGIRFLTITDLIFQRNVTFLPDIKTCKMDKKRFDIKAIVFHRLWRSEKTGIGAIVFIVLVSIIYSGAITYAHDLMPTLTVAYTDPDNGQVREAPPPLPSRLAAICGRCIVVWLGYGQLGVDKTSPKYNNTFTTVSKKDRSMFFFYTYANTLSRAAPYFIGILTGYLLIKKPDIKIPKILQVVCWCLASLICSCVIFITGAWFKAYTPSTLELVIYAALYKTVFTLGIAWMTFCCVTGSGGIINKFLSWKLWVPLSKLTFLIYLIHPYLQNVFIATFRGVQEVSHIRFIIQFFGFLCISGLLAFIASLLIESPLLAMEKVLFGRGEKKRRKK